MPTLDIVPVFDSIVRIDNRDMRDSLISPHDDTEENIMSVQKHIPHEPEESPIVFYLFMGVLGLAAIGAVAYVIFG